MTTRGRRHRGGQPVKLYREVRIETADDLDQLEEYYVKETSPGGAWQIVLVPIEAEEEWGEDEDADTYTPTRRLVTPWEEQS